MLLLIGTLETDGADAFVVGVAAMDGLCWIYFLVNRKSCCISSDTLLLPKVLMALEQSDIAAITLFACVMVGRVILLWLNFTVSVYRLLLIVLIWHRYVR